VGQNKDAKLVTVGIPDVRRMALAAEHIDAIDTTWDRVVPTGKEVRQ
jgi:hypothetical protein